MTVVPLQQGFVPRIRLFTTAVLVDRGELFPALEETWAPGIELRFDYGARSFRPSRRESPAPGRDLEAEARACYLLESLGAADLDCLEHYERIDDEADFIVAPESDVHTICAFSAFALPQLRALGWGVEVDPGYRWQVVSAQASWYGGLESGAEDADWFSLELGVEVDGHRVNLLPALLGLLEGISSLRARRSTTRRCLAAPIDGHRYVALPPERAEALLEVLKELYLGARVEDGHLRLPLDQTPRIAELDEVFRGRDSLSWRGSREAHDLALAATRPAALDEIPAGLQASLRPYQRDGLAWLQHLHRHGAGGILADDMGLGKTLQTIADLVIEHEGGGASLPSLIVCPTSLVTNWERELRRFAPSLRVLVLTGAERHRRFAELPRTDVALTSYPLLTRDFDELLRQRFHLLVLDEAQAIKNSTSQAHRAARALPADHRLCLSGTPLENNLGELWALFDFLMPGHLGDADRFRQHYRTPIEQGAPGRLESLRQRVAPFILRRTKDEVLAELPPKTEMVRAVELGGAQRELYESIRVAAHAEVRRAIAEKGIARSTITILDALLKLRQVCCDPRLVKLPCARGVRDSAKLATLLELLEQQRREGRRVLVFSQFASMLGLIAAALEEKHIPCLTLTGETRDRQARIDAFAEGAADLFLISLKAGGTGLNLTRADTVIHYDPWWNPAVQAQATDRAHRFGQTRPVFVYNLIAAGSVEERMLRLQQHKRALADSILAGTASSGLSEREVDDLFSPLEAASNKLEGSSGQAVYSLPCEPQPSF